MSFPATPTGDPYAAPAYSPMPYAGPSHAAMGPPAYPGGPALEAYAGPAPGMAMMAAAAAAPPPAAMVPMLMRLPSPAEAAATVFVPTISVHVHTPVTSGSVTTYSLDLSLTLADGAMYSHKTDAIRYSMIEKIFTFLPAPDHHEYKVPSFPPKAWFGNTDPVWVAKRADGLTQYLNGALNAVPMASSHIVLKELCIPHDSPVVHALHVHDDAFRARAAAAAAAKAAILEAQFQLSQTFHRAPPTPMASSAEAASRGEIAYYAPPVLTYPFPAHYLISDKLWSFGDAKIFSRGRPYFCLERTNPSMFQSWTRDAVYQLSTLNHEPLIMLQEIWKLFAFKYRIHRQVPVSEHGHMTTKLVKMCSIRRTMFGYTVKMAGDKHDKHREHDILLTYRGWGDYHFVRGGNIVAQASRQMFTLGAPQYDLEIAPNADTLLFLALTIAVDKIVTERRNK